MSESLSAGALCTRIVEVVYPDLSLAEAARLMRERHVGCLVVVSRSSPGRRVAGMITDRDIVVSAVAEGLDANTITVADLMSTELALAEEDDSLPAVLGLMREHGVRRLPVVDQHGHLVGLLSMDDVMAAFSLQFQGLVEAMINERQRETSARA